MFGIALALALALVFVFVFVLVLVLCYMNQWIMAMRAIGCFVAVSSN